MLIDTSGFLCLYESAEPHHDDALRLYDAAVNRWTTNYVLAEYTALAQIRRIPREQIIEFSWKVMTDDDLSIVWVDERLHAEAARLMMERSDKTYSLCDAVSFCVMRANRITSALTTDKHFEQEGFERLLV